MRNKTICFFLAALSVLQLASCAVKTERKIILPDTVGEEISLKGEDPIETSPFAYDPEEEQISTETEKTEETEPKSSTEESEKAETTTPKTTEPKTSDPEETEWVDNRAEEDIEEEEDDAVYVEFDPNTLETGKHSGETMFRDVPLPAFKQLYVFETAERFGVPAELVFGVMKTETGYNETLSSKNGRYIGIMQISIINMDFLYKMFGTTDLQDFNQNVEAGVYFLSKAYKKYNGDIDKTLMCYHMGEGGAKKAWANGKTTDGYCSKVKTEMNRIVNAGWVDASQLE